MTEKKTKLDFFFRRILNRVAALSGLAMLLLLAWSASAWAWPTDSQWIKLVKGGTPIQDDEGDANGGVNVVPNDGSHAAAFIYNDGAYLYYRIRLDGDPTGNNGIFDQFGWGFEIDTDQNAADYEWLIMCDGISSPEVISLRENTDKTGLGDPSDKAEYVAAEYPLVGNHQLSLADTAINGDQDYFLDFRMPFAVFKAATGITDDTLIRYFVGSSRSTNNLTDNGADLVAGSTLYEMGSDYITPFGTLPLGTIFYDGSVQFTEDLSGFGDESLAAPGDTLYIAVNDLDLDSSTNPLGTLRVELTSPTGDIEVLILTATGVQGKYTGSIPTSSTGNADGTLYVLDNQTVTATYVEAVAANRSQSVPRTDTILFTAIGTNIGITKTVDTAVANEGDTVTFTVTATNNGPSAVTALTVSDPLPTGLTYVSDNSGGGYVPTTGIWSVGGLAKDSSAILILQATVDTGTSSSTLTNTASLATSTPTDRYANNDSASASIEIDGTDLRVTKDVTDPLPTEGDVITYRIRVLNLGPNAATGVQVQDILPTEGVTYISDNSGGSYDHITGIWDVGAIPADDGYLLRIDVSVKPGTFGQTFTNTASILSADQPDPDTSNNSASVNIKVDYLDLELTKSVDNDTPDAGDTVVFTITVTNNGPHDASGVVVTDQLPTGITYISDNSGGSYDPVAGTWSVGDLDNKNHATLTITATVDAGTDGQTIINEAEITAVDQPDSNLGNEYATASVHVAGTDLEISKTVDNLTPAEGDVVTWTITVINNGPNPATGAEITDILPAGVSYSSNNPSQGSFDYKKSQVWKVGALPVFDGVNGKATLELTSTVDGGTSGQNIVNVAFLTASDQTDSNEFNNTASALIAVNGTDLEISKTVDNSAPRIGDFINYTITLTNNGPSDATNVEVTDLLPPELSYNSATPEQGSYDSSTGIWTVGSLSATTGSNTVTLNLNIEILNEDNHLLITNTASISAVDQGDPDSSNNNSSVDITISAVDLAVNKTVDVPTPNEGSIVIYTVSVTNNSLNDATNIEIDDILPVGVTYLGSTPNQGIYAAGLWFVGNLAAGDTATVQINATVDSGTAGSTITNVASLSALDQIDTDSSNDTASVDIEPIVLLLPSITFLKTVQTDSDPINGAINPKAIPGAAVLYTLQAINFGPASPDEGSLVITDPIPANTSLFVGDLGQGNPVLFTDVMSSGFVLGDVNVSYSADADCSDFSYVPTPDADGYDADVCQLRVGMNGIFNASDGVSNPSFSLQFFVRID
jgi:uncharacterized repeat protein (TIGR01451 family)